MRPRLTFANVISLLALFVALGSGAYAATQLPKNSVGSKQIKKNAVNSAKVKDRSLKASDFQAGQLPAGPQGPQGAQGPKGDTGAPGATSVVARRAIVTNIGNGAQAEELVFCEDGERLVGGGAGFVDNEDKYDFPSKLHASLPLNGNSLAAKEGESGFGWRASATNETGATRNFVVIALCAKP